MKNVIIENNICLNNQAQICNLEGNAANGYSEISDIIFRNNIFVNIYYQANCYAAKCKWYNNTFYKCSIGPGAFSHVLLIAGPMSEIKNNLFIECGPSGAFTTYGFYVIDALATGSIADYNYVAGRNNFDSKTNFTEVHGINGGDPKFVNIAKNNFRLLLGSNAIDKGTTINGLNTDIEGTQRPKGNANDIGAYEFK